MRRLLCALIVLALLWPSSLAEANDSGVDDLNRVFYEIFVGSFSDSDGDGVGDLRGIINRMDYLNSGNPDSAASLGVEGLWLTPIFASRPTTSMTCPISARSTRRSVRWTI